MVHSTNGWTESIYTAQAMMFMSVEHMKNTRVHITVSLSFMVINGQTIVHMTAGGGMIRLPKLNYEESKELENYILDYR